MAESYTNRTLRELIRILASRFIGIVLIIAVIVGSVTVASLLAPKWYRSEVQLMASPGGMTNPLESSNATLRESVSLFISTQREIIMSDYVLASALMRIDPAWKEKANKDASLTQPKYEKDDVEDYIAKNSEKLREFRGRVSVVTPGGEDATFTQTFKIRLDWPEQRGNDALANGNSRQEAAGECFELTKLLAEAYLARYSYLKYQEAEKAAKFIDQTPLKKAKERLDKAQVALDKFNGEWGPDLVTIASINGEQGIDSGAMVVLTNLENTVNRLNQEISTYQALKAEIDKELARADHTTITAPDEVIKSNVAVHDLVQKVVELKVKLNVLEPQYTPEYRAIKVAREELANTANDLHGELKIQSRRLGMSIAKLQAQKQIAEVERKRTHDKMIKIGSQVANYERMKREFNSAMDNYEEEFKTYQQALRARSLAKDPVLVTMLDAPSRPNPNDPRRPILWLNILLASVASVVLALMYAFLADHYDHTIRSVDDAERYLGTPVVGSVPKLSRKMIKR